jgi:ABC-type transporter Mla maintaining outer membrane lipid asymmetry permease subunit MlaE
VSNAVWPPLALWSNFYIMAGSSAAALTGLMFVVITLTAGLERRGTQDGVSTFSTPTVVHFCAALLASAILVAPWPSSQGPALAIGIASLVGIAYSVRVIYRTWRLTTYSADLEDWAGYAILPLVAYVALLASAIALQAFAPKALFVIAAAVVLLIFLGIHNAWDTVTYLAIKRDDETPPSSF